MILFSFFNIFKLSLVLFSFLFVFFSSFKPKNLVKVNFYTHKHLFNLFPYKYIIYFMVFSSDLHIYCNYRASSLSLARPLALVLFHSLSLQRTQCLSLALCSVCLCVSLSRSLSVSHLLNRSDDVAWVSCMLYKSFVHF